MKKSLLALAALTTFAGAASAQSSVTLFGVMDLAVRNVKNGSLSATGMVSGANTTSRWGIRGSEDLGGGTRAQFWLESGINGDNGTSSSTTAFFDRRATVSLVNASAGEVRLGRDYTPTHSASCAFDVFYCNGVASINFFRSTSAQVFGAAASGGLGSTNPAVRANNAVQYLTPGTLGGFFAQLMVSAGEGTAATGATENSKAQGLRVGYTAGPVNVQAAMDNIKNTAPTGSPTFKDTVLGASYDFGVAKVSLSRRTYKMAAAKLASTAFNVNAPVGPGAVKFQYIKANQDGTVAANDATLVGIGYQYDLSKRTALYGTIARISNKGAATFANTVAAGVPAITGGQRSNGVELGLRHNF